MLITSLAIAHEDAAKPSAGSDPTQAGHERSELDLEKSVNSAPKAIDHHALVHPFLAHMGMPDGPGEVSVRIMSVEERNAGLASGTYGFHIEAGIIDRLGLHLRNDAIRTHSSTEMMLQYAIFRSDDGLSGISAIGEVEFPTGSTEDNRTQGLYGISFAYLRIPFFAVNSVVHYSPVEKMVVWEISLVARMTHKIFPVLELSGESGQDMSFTNALFAWKFKIPNNNAIGVGYRLPITKAREFESQLLLQAEFGFE